MPTPAAGGIEAQWLTTPLTNQVTVAFVQLRGPSTTEKDPNTTHPVTARTTATWTPQAKQSRVARACAIVDALADCPNPPQIIVFSEYCVPLDSDTLGTLRAKAIERNVIVVPGADNVDAGPVNFAYVVEPSGAPRPVQKLHRSKHEHWLDHQEESGHPLFAWEFNAKTYHLAIRVCWDFDATKADDLQGPILVIAPMNSKDVFENHAKDLVRDVGGGAAFILCNAIGGSGEATGSSRAIAMLPAGNGTEAQLPTDREACGIVTVDMDNLVSPKVAAHVTRRALEAPRRFLIKGHETAVKLHPMPHDALAPMPGATRAIGADEPPIMPGILRGPSDSRLIHDTGFVGHQTEVLRLSDLLLRAGDSALERLVVVTGEPGIGKTELCKAVLSRCLGSAAAGPQRILWVDATRAITPDEFVGRFAVALGRTTVSRAEDIVADLRTYPAIVYVDNLEDALTDAARAANAGLLRDIFAASGKRILATSQVALPGQALLVPVDPLADADAVKVFVQAARDAGNETPPADDERLREFLRVDLGNHPLALAVVGSHVGPGVQWVDVRDRWRQKFERVAAVPGGSALKSQNLEASIDLTFDKLQGGGALARRLWGFLAYFPEGIAPLRLKPVLGADPDEILGASDLLCRHSVARRKEGSLRILPPMASYIRDAARKEKGGLNHKYFQTRLLDWFGLLWDDVEIHRTDSKKRGETLDAFLANTQALLVLARDINANADTKEVSA